MAASRPLGLTGLVLAIVVGVTAPSNAAGARPAWIWQGPGEAADTWMAFRRTVTVARPPRSAPVKLAVDSKYWLWVNGAPVVFEGGLKRGPTPRDTYHDEVDLGPHLRAGANTIAVLVWYWGKDGFSHKSSGAGGLWIDGGRALPELTSGPGWKARKHPGFVHEAGGPNFRLPEHDVVFDARLDLPGWTAPGYDDAAWSAAEPRGEAPAAPWGALVRRPIPLWRDLGRRAYVRGPALPLRSNGALIVMGLPHNAQVTPYLKVRATAGQRIEVRTDAYLDGREKNVRGVYITRDGEQEHESLGWMSGHEVWYEIPAGVEVLALGYRETGYATDLVPGFRSSDPALDALWAKAQRTLYVNMRDSFLDCPTRERALWWPDLPVQSLQAYYAFDRRADALVGKALRELFAWRRPDGVLYSPVPAGNWRDELPVPSLQAIGWYGTWQHYLYTGDRALLAEGHPHARAYLALWRTGPDGLLLPRPGEWDFSDWGQNQDRPVSNNAWYALALRGAAATARALGDHQEEARHRRALEALAVAFRRAFWTGEAFRSPGHEGPPDDRGNALAVLAGLATPADREALLRVLERERHASPFMEKYVLEALFSLEAPRAALARMKERYAEMIAAPLTTLPEGWDRAQWGRRWTVNHAFSGGPLALLSRHVAGIAPRAPGFVAYDVVPQLGTLTSVSARVESPRGAILVDLAQERGRRALTLQSPGETVAHVGLPTEGLSPPLALTVNGRPVPLDGRPALPPGLVWRGVSGDRVRLEAAPGRWRFELIEARLVSAKAAPRR